MKTFDGKNHYEVLRIPYDAESGEIRQAYEAALEVYEENSLVTYSLFSDAQRKDLLQAIDDAFYTLIDGAKRAAYNQMLVDTGQAAAVSFEKKNEPGAAGAATAPAAEPVPAAVRPRDIREWVRKKSREEHVRRLIEEVAGKELVSGNDLQRLREAFDISLAEIFDSTRISTSVLAMIEANQYDKLPAEVFLKGFLKSLAEIFQIDPRKTVSGYMKHKSLAKPK